MHLLPFLPLPSWILFSLCGCVDHASIEKSSIVAAVIVSAALQMKRACLDARKVVVFSCGVL